MLKIWTCTAHGLTNATFNRMQILKSKTGFFFRCGRFENARKSVYFSVAIVTCVYWRTRINKCNILHYYVCKRTADLMGFSWKIRVHVFVAVAFWIFVNLIAAFRYSLLMYAHVLFLLCVCQMHLNSIYKFLRDTTLKSNMEKITAL